MNEVWKSAIDGLPNIIWGIIWISAVVVVLIKCIPCFELWLNYYKEKKLKELAFEHETKFYFNRKISEDALKLLSEKNEQLQKEIEELKRNLKSEKESRENVLKAERLQFEHDYYKQLLEQLSTK